MEAKEELSQYKFARKRVDKALEEYERFKERAEKMTAILSDVPSRSNKTSDKVGDNAVLMADIDREYQKRWYEAEQSKLDIEKKIDKVIEPYRTLLLDRYILDMSLEQIAVEMNYSYEYVRHLHGEALEKYREVDTL